MKSAANSIKRRGGILCNLSGNQIFITLLPIWFLGQRSGPVQLSRNESDLSKEKINNLQDIVIDNKKAVRPRDSATPPRSGERGIRSERIPQCNTII